jgi:hypothetical protein
MRFPGFGDAPTGHTVEGKQPQGHWLCPVGGPSGGFISRYPWWLADQRITGPPAWGRSCRDSCRDTMSPGASLQVHPDKETTTMHGALVKGLGTAMFVLAAR